MNSKAFEMSLTSFSGLGRQHLTKHHLLMFISFPKHMFQSENRLVPNWKHKSTSFPLIDNNDTHLLASSGVPSCSGL